MLINPLAAARLTRRKPKNGNITRRRLTPAEGHLTFMADDSIVEKTPLFDLHVELGGRMVPFAGYSMPVQFPAGIIKEHQHTRTQAGLFDVSHMGQLIISGPDVTSALERLLPTDLAELEDNQQIYSVLTNETGGILDDLIITRFSADRFFLVINAACKAQDTAHLRQHLPANITIEALADRALLALQGPTAKDVLGALTPSVHQLTFMHGCHATIDGAECYITRSGYTGEDGFEISVPNTEAERIARLLLSHADVAPIGLGARDSLRLEAGLCLYGHDMDANISPVEAVLMFAISKSRRSQGDKAGGFLGSETILSQIDQGVSRKRVGLRVEGRIPVREGCPIVDDAGNEIGHITSGGFGPTLQAPVALGYVPTSFAKRDTQLFALLRGKNIPITVTRTPFVPQNYYRG
jgi:aminomethyltransferase